MIQSRGPLEVLKPLRFIVLFVALLKSFSTWYPRGFVFARALLPSLWNLKAGIYIQGLTSNFIHLLEHIAELL